MVQYKHDEIYGDCRDFSHSPIQGGVSPPLKEPELNLNTISQGINSSNLDKIEHMVLQNKLEFLSETLNTDEEVNNNAVKRQIFDKCLSQKLRRLHYVY